MEWKCTWMENESNSYFDSIYFDEFTLDQYINILHSRQQETKILFRGGGYWKCVEKCYIKWMEYNIQSSAHNTKLGNDDIAGFMCTLSTQTQ